MNSIEQIKTLKLQYRLCRKKVPSLKSIISIVDECCSILKLEVPEIIFCESLKKDFQCFSLRGKEFFIYDSCLIEALFLYDGILFSECKMDDMNKFFYKLFCEEFLLQDDVLTSMYFAGKYNNLSFSFDSNTTSENRLLRLSMENYFLIGHELTHLSLNSGKQYSISKEYKKYVAGCMAGLAKKAIDSNNPVEKVLSERAPYFLETTPSSIADYFEMLNSSKKFDDFVEECYCDFMSFKMLMEHYENKQAATEAIFSALSCLIVLECLRSSVTEGIDYVKEGSNISNESMFYSVMRTHLLLVVVETNELNSEFALHSVHDRSIITESLMSFINALPDKDTFTTISEKYFPKGLTAKDVKDIIIKQLYCISVSSELY